MHCCGRILGPNKVLWKYKIANWHSWENIVGYPQYTHIIPVYLVKLMKETICLWWTNHPRDTKRRQGCLFFTSLDKHHCLLSILIKTSPPGPRPLSGFLAFLFRLLGFLYQLSVSLGGLCVPLFDVYKQETMGSVCKLG